MTKTLAEASLDDATTQFDLPSGRLGYGESLEEALQRELKEEIGIDDYRLERVLMAKTFVRNDGLQLTVITYLVCVKETRIQLSHEHCESCWFKYEDIENLPPWMIETIQLVN